MGNISSRPGLDDGAAVFLRDQHRFAVASAAILNAKQRLLLSVSPDAFPASRAVAKRDPLEETPVDFIQDLEGAQSAPFPTFLLRLNNADDPTFTFSLVVRRSLPPPPAAGDQAAAALTDTVIHGLTFIFAPNLKDLDALVNREFHADPNFHKNPNVELVASELSTDGAASVQLDYAWKWRPPKAAEDKGGGWRNVCAFVEYDQRAHKLNTLATFAFWVQNTRTFPSAPFRTSQYEMLGAPRIRVASSTSAQSVVSDSEGPNERDLPSPVAEAESYSAPVTQTTTNNTVVDVACQRPGEDLSAVDDGPLFRATMKALEQKTGSMKGRMKKLLKRATEAHGAQNQCNEAMKQFMAALREAAASNANAIQPALEHYFEKIAQQILRYEKDNSNNLQRLIIEPLTKLYNLDIKQAESKKRDFEDESKDYYSYVGRYLGQRQDSLKEKKRIESDSKYQSKRRNFELKRFDYSSFMQDLHGGRKEQEMLSHLTRYADTQTKSYLATSKKIEELMPQLDALVREVNEADKEFQMQRTEREEKRRTIEKSAKPYVDTDVAHASNAAPNGSVAESETVKMEGGARGLQHSNSTGSQSGAAGPPGVGLGPSNSLKATTTSSTTSPIQDRSKGFREINDREGALPTVGERTTGLQRKEGLLWALSRPGSLADPRGLNKQAWHKYWLVLDQGKLSEYSNWKERLDLHMDPIDVRLASVREARNSERRFCFEVITPNFKRVYQAPSEEDMNSWIGAINNAVQGAFEARSQPQSFDPSPTEASLKRDIGSVLTGKSPTHHMREPSGYQGQASGGASANAGVHRRITVGARPSYIRSDSASYEDNPKKLLQDVRGRDEGNLACADCRSTASAEWVSINLGVVVCIDCGGVHRSLGTHVSKVRSLTLDTVSFTVDIVALLLALGNTRGNAVWEATLDPARKPAPAAAWEERRQFITDKYVRRAYVAPLSPALSAFATPDEALLASVKRNDIGQVMYALALRASPNAADKSRRTPAVFLALAAADPASPHATPPIPVPGASGAAGAGGLGVMTRPMAFPVAELLLQNGGEMPSTMPAFPLSAAAQQYVEQKRTKETVSALPQIRSPGERERERLQKRASAGNRFGGRSAGP